MPQPVKCAICDVDDARYLLTKNGLVLVKCRRCELVYVNPRPETTELAAIYNDDAFHCHQLQAEETQQNVSRDLDRAELIARNQPTLGRLLDVGCSTGSFLRAARERGFDVSGIDIGHANVAHARMVGLDAYVGVITEAPFASRSFDVITFFDSIEHMPHPVAALEAARTLLSGDGLLVLTTPNIDGWFPRLTWQLLGRTLGVWEHPAPPGHVYQFSRATLRKALEKAGFDEVWARTEGIPVGYTVGALEQAIVDAVKERMGPRQAPRIAMASATVNAPLNARGRRSGSPVRRALRSSIRAASWLLAGALSPPAAWMDHGDSMIVLARHLPVTPTSRPTPR
jgi:2-polyprenyl-3-methyl-5-hydroxy-6-metoxy-1,4-benzoquinol methylase